jgi:acetyl esterase
MTLNRQARQMLELLESRGGKPVPDSTVAEVRAANWDWVEFMGDPEPVVRVEGTYIPGPSAELHVRVYTPHGTGPFPCLVYFHGGGWTAGNLHIADRPTRSLANATGCVIVAVNYQKAPEHRFPTPLDDCFAAVEWVTQQAAALDVDPAKIGVGGDSAGGNLAAAVSLKARDAGRPPLAFQLLIYPAVDPDMNFPSARDNAEGYSLTTADMRWFWNNYVPDPAQRNDPLAAPLRAESLRDVPPAIVVTAEYDPLRDEGERYADRLEEAGVTVRRRSYRGTIHGFLWMADALSDDFRQLMEDLSQDVPALLQESATARRSS